MKAILFAAALLMLAIPAMAAEKLSDSQLDSVTAGLLGFTNFVIAAPPATNPNYPADPTPIDYPPLQRIPLTFIGGFLP